MKSFKIAQPQLRKRVQILAASLLATGLLAGIYFGVAPRYYAASADLIFQFESEDQGTEKLPSPDDAPTEALSAAKLFLTSDLVLGQVIANLPEAHQVDWKDLPTEVPREVLRKNLELYAVPGDRTIRVCCRSRQPETAVVILEKILELCQVPVDSTATADSSADAEHLVSELQSVEQNLHAKEEELASLKQAFESRFGVSPASESEYQDSNRERFRALELARKKHHAAKTRLAAIEESIRNGWERSPAISHAPPEHAHCAHETPQAVAANRQLLIALEARLEDLLRRYGPAHSKIREIQDRIRRTEAWLNEQDAVPAPQIIQVAERDPVFDQLILAREQLESAKDYEDLVREQYEIEQARSIERANRLSQIATAQKEREDLIRAHAAIFHRQESSKPLPKTSPEKPFTVIAPPEEPGELQTPNLARCLSMSQGLGLLLGLSAIIIIERRKQGIRVLEQFQQSLNVPVIGWIGELSPTRGNGLDAVQTWARLDPNQTAGFEALRSFLEQNREARWLAVTSGTMGEGKSTVTANLAVEFAQAGKKTLFIDADIAGKGLSKLLQFNDSRGLANLLCEDVPMAESAERNIVPTLQPGLDVLPAGAEWKVDRGHWEGPRWREFLCWVESIYEQVLIDLPAFLPESDVERIGRAADGLLLVVQAERMEPKTVNAVLKRLETANLTCAGIVANRMSIPRDVQSEAEETESQAIPDRNAETA